MGFVVKAFDRTMLDHWVHALDLAVGPGMLGLGTAIVDACRDGRQHCQIAEM